ncbi:monocarboxylate transporter 12-like [Stegodyphus dumicola]|uniref:monocarboxylate transporter 12-like n=1 Tax=Stegodyphus dumicola TaxID=202533 RepID=UPI0015B17F77|nr:monocarboxylate transporter 12-like [Stegodyphus dumicola]
MSVKKKGFSDVEEDDSDVPKPPDGGWGWVIVFCSFMIQLISFGISLVFGIYYVEFLRYFGESNGATSWVLSIMNAMTFCVGPLASGLTKQFGCRAVTITGALLAAFGLIISIFAPCVTFLYFSIGICAGAGIGFMYFTVIVCVASYFEEKRALATGISVCGASIGLFLLAPLTEWIVRLFGWQGGMLITAGITLNCCIFGAFFRPLKKKNKIRSRVLFSNSSNLPLDSNMKRVFNETFGNNGEVCLSTVTAEASVKLPTVTPQVNYNSLHFSFNNQISQLPSSTAKSPISETNRSSHLHTGFAPRAKGICTVNSHKSKEEVPEEIAKDNTISEQSMVIRLSNCLFPLVIKDTFKEMMNFRLLEDNAFLILTISNFFTNIGLDIPYIYTQDRVIDMKIADEVYASYLLSVTGIASAVSRIIFGYLSDLSCINSMWLYSTILIICGVNTAFSSFCEDYYLMAVYSAIFGGMSGGYNSLQSIVLVDLVGLKKLTNGFGVLLLFEGVACLIGPPITGWLYDYTRSYDPGFYVSGFMMAFSGFMLFFIPCVQRISGRKNRKGEDFLNMSVPARTELALTESKSHEEICTKM